METSWLSLQIIKKHFVADLGFTNVGEGWTWVISIHSFIYFIFVVFIYIYTEADLDAVLI